MQASTSKGNNVLRDDSSRIETVYTRIQRYVRLSSSPNSLPQTFTITNAATIWNSRTKYFSFVIRYLLSDMKIVACWFCCKLHVYMFVYVCIHTRTQVYYMYYSKEKKMENSATSDAPGMGTESWVWEWWRNRSTRTGSTCVYRNNTW